MVWQLNSCSNLLLLISNNLLLAHTMTQRDNYFDLKEADLFRDTSDGN